MSGLFSSFKTAAMSSGVGHTSRSGGRRRHDVDTRMRFSVEPFVGDSGFAQWHDAMRMVARLPGGIPKEFRKRLWLTMAEKHVQHRKVDWDRVKRFCFNERSNPDDNELGVQIVKDLHRTGCSLFCGDDAEHNQALLKRVLLAYARWNKTVGYCQGFNMLAALILEVMEWKEEDALKVMIYLIEGVLPESYFANNLRGLSVDMAVFRDLLRLRLTSLSRHLDHLQLEARDSVSGTSYEPPLTNVFTMQWFLTLFSNCLPKGTVLRVWDFIFLEGNEVLLRTALTIWDGLADRIMAVNSADEFYSIMGVLTREMLEFGLMDANHLVKTICTMAPFPFPQLGELRDKYTYNITPFTVAVGVARRGLRLFYSDDEEEQNEDEQLAVAAWCFASVFPPQLSPIKSKAGEGARSPSPSTNGTNFMSIGPGAFGFSSSSTSSANAAVHFPDPTGSRRHPCEADRTSLDISALKKQYAKLRERQKQAHVILAAASSAQPQRQQAATATGAGGLGARRPQIAVNHLLIGKKPLISRRSSQSSMKGLVKFRFKTDGSQAPVAKSSVAAKTADAGGSGGEQSGSRKRSDGDGRKVLTRPSSVDNTKDEVTRSSSSSVGGRIHAKLKNRVHSVQTFESGETLHWKDAKRREIGSESDVSKLSERVDQNKLSYDFLDKDKEDTSSTSTELCDEDIGRVSDLESDPEVEDTAAGKALASGRSPTTTTTSTDRHTCSVLTLRGDFKQLPSLSESSDGEAASLPSETATVSTTTTTLPSVVVSPGGCNEWPHDDVAAESASPSPSQSKDMFESDLESEPGLSVSKWIDSFDRGLLDTDDYRVLEVDGAGGAIVEVSTVVTSTAAVGEDDDYSVEKRGEWLAKLEMYRRTLGVDTEIRTSSDEYHSCSDSVTTTATEEDDDVDSLEVGKAPERPTTLLPAMDDEEPSPRPPSSIDFEEVVATATVTAAASTTATTNLSSSYADRQRVKRYFDQGSPIRNVPTAYVPSRIGSIFTDMEGFGQPYTPTTPTVTSTIQSSAKTAATATSAKSSAAIFNPFPTARKSQLWGNNEIGVRLGLYGHPSSSPPPSKVAETANKKQLGHR